MTKLRRDEFERTPQPCKFLARCFVAALFICLIWGLIYMPLKQHSGINLPASLSWMIEQRDLTRYIQPDNNTFLLKPPVDKENSSFMNVVICSAVPNFASRQAIRNTWARDAHTLDVQVMFLLGTSRNESLNSAIVRESQNHQDIIQGDFLDTYNNLTLKSVMLLKWVKECSINTKYVMKTDDDMFVNIPNLVKLLRQKDHKRMLIGCLIQGAEPIKDWGSKWFVPDTIFPERTYPPYLSGTGYVMSIDAVPVLFKTAINTPFFYLEDIFITGVCARRAGLKPVNNDGFKFYKRKNDACVFRSLITAHKMAAKELVEIFAKVHDPSIKCKH